MNRCLRCLIPSTRPDTAFVDGVCSACISYERRPQIDWMDRKRALLNLLDRHNGRCIVPSSGGKDSHYQVLTLLELGAKVTIVTATTCMLTEIGRKNIDNLARYAPTMEFTPNMTQRAKLNRLGLEMVGDISWPEHCAIFTVPFRAAVMLGIPLIFYGENPQDQYGGPPGSEQAREMTRRWVSEFGGFLGLRPADMEPLAGDMSYYTPPSAAELAGVEAHFLGQYIPWDSHANAVSASAAGMLYPETGPCTANCWPWENLDNAMTGIHDYFMYLKYGYSRAHAQLSVDIRSGRIQREEALGRIYARADWFPTVYIGVHYLQVLDRLGISAMEFHKIADAFTNWALFEKTSWGGVKLKEELLCD